MRQADRRNENETWGNSFIWLKVSGVVMLITTVSFVLISRNPARYTDGSFARISLYGGVRNDTELQLESSSEPCPKPTVEPETALEAAKVEFALQELGRMRCLMDIQSSLRDAMQPYLKNARSVAFIDIPLHTNLGDNVLWRGTMKLLADFKRSPDTVCLFTAGSGDIHLDGRFPPCSLEDTVRIAEKGGVVLFPPGGSWGDLWRHTPNLKLPFLTKLSEASKTHNFTAIQLSQSISYSAGSKYIEGDAQVLAGLEPGFFTLFVRNRDSYEFGVKHYPTTKTVLTPDFAFGVGHLLPSKAPKYDVLVLLRNDHEAKPEDVHVASWAGQLFADANMTFTVHDWNYISQQHPWEFSNATAGALAEVRTSAAVDILCEAKIIVTNRLHGSIVATMVGKHLFYVDTKEGKVGGTRSASFAVSDSCTPENLHSHKAGNMREAIEGAIALYKSKGENFVYN